MRIAQSGIVRKVYKDHTGFYVVEVERINTAVKGTTKYIGFKQRPKVQIGQMVKAGEEI